MKNMKKANLKGAIPLRERLTLGDEWAEFGARIVPKDAPDVQRTEMRRAFYAGAGSMFGLMTGGLDEDREPTDLDLAYVSSLAEEIQQFARDIEAGRA